MPLVRGALLVGNKWIDARVHEAGEVKKRKKNICERVWPSSLLFRKNILTALAVLGGALVLLSNTSAAKVMPFFPSCLGSEVCHEVVNRECVINLEGIKHPP